MSLNFARSLPLLLLFALSLQGCATAKSKLASGVTTTVEVVGDAVGVVGGVVGNAAGVVGGAVGNAAGAVGGAVKVVGGAVTDTVVSTASITADTMTSTVQLTANATVDTVGTQVNKSAVWVGETTGSNTLVKAGTAMTPRQSYILGRTCAAKVLSQNELITSKDVSAYVNTLGNYLALHSQAPQIYNGYHFVVIEGAEPHAISAPGGFVFISTGMLMTVQNEDELAAVLAHEIAHISLNHAEEAIQTANRLDIFGGGVLKTLSFATDYATKTVGLDKVKVLDDLKVLKLLKIFDVVTDIVLNNGFNQPQEYEADNEALKILKSAGYAPRALASMIQSLPEGATFTGLHPGGADRIDAIELRLRKDERNGEATRALASTNATLAPASPADALALEKKRLNRFLSFRQLLKPVDRVNDRY